MGAQAGVFVEDLKTLRNGVLSRRSGRSPGIQAKPLDFDFPSTFSEVRIRGSALSELSLLPESPLPDDSGSDRGPGQDLDDPGLVLLRVDVDAALDLPGNYAFLDGRWQLGAKTRIGIEKGIWFDCDESILA